MLIKAPIGSGKSFLFFDGPIYGLYKYSARNILNTKSKEWYIKVIFEVNQETYLIIRNIKKGKSKDSCESKLYKLEWTFDFADESPLQHDKDIETLLRQDGSIQRDEITFKNETDLQQTLQTILPPREVIMNTIFLMQDSDNIFELTPVDRLTILKNVFNLMGIDEAKDILADKKREIRYKIKSKTDISKYDEKLKNSIKSYLSTFDDTTTKIHNAFDFQEEQKFFDERKLIEEKIQITDFSLKDFPSNRDQKLTTYVQEKKSQEQKLLHQLETLQQDIFQEQKKIKDQETNEIEFTNNIQTLQKKIEAIDEKKITEAKTQKQKIIEEQNQKEKQLAKDYIRTYIQTQNNETNIQTKEDITLLSSYMYIQQLINQGKQLGEEIKTIQLQIQNEELITKNNAEKIATQKKHLQEKLEDQEQQLKKIDETLADIEKNIDTQAAFACEKINGQCPFIKVINKKTFDQLDQQKKTFQEEKSKIISIREERIQDIKKLEIVWPKEESTTKDQRAKQQQEAEQKIASIKNFLQEIDYKTIETQYTEYINQEKIIKELDTYINQQEQEMKQREERKLELHKAATQKESIEKQVQEYKKSIQEKETAYQQITKEKAGLDQENTLHIEKNHSFMQQTYRDIDLLINEFKEQQLERQKLEEQETILGNLYTIFSKELLLLVLQDHLPVLNDIINSYLSQIVDYQISLQLNKSDADKVELEAKIIDQKGIRDTKSLSGGQRIILKLIRMLAISSYINSPILFLDETINNLDEDTVGKVANMLEDFVKQREIKFYTITHSQQIQQMDIRDQTIEID